MERKIQSIIDYKEADKWINAFVNAAKALNVYADREPYVVMEEWPESAKREVYATLGDFWNYIKHVKHCRGEAGEVIEYIEEKVDQECQKNGLLVEYGDLISIVSEKMFNHGIKRKRDSSISGSASMELDELSEKMSTSSIEEVPQKLIRLKESEKKQHRPQVTPKRNLSKFVKKDSKDSFFMNL